MSEVPNNIYPDIVEENTLSEDFTGYTATRKFILQNVRGNATQRTYNALNDQRIPKMKQAHPSIPSIKVSSRNAAVSIQDPNVMIVTIQYAVLPDEEVEVEPAVFNIGTTSATEETNYAYGANNPNSPGSPVVMSDVKQKMVVKHRFGSNHNPAYASVSAVPTVSREFPSGVVTFPRTELTNPMKTKRRFEGTVNAGVFLGDPARTWLCSRITATTQNGGESWQVEYEFQYKAETWDTTLFYEDPDSGKVPTDAKPHVFSLYKAEDFTFLAIPQLVGP